MQINTPAYFAYLSLLLVLLGSIIPRSCSCRVSLGSLGEVNRQATAGLPCCRSITRPANSCYQAHRKCSCNSQSCWSVYWGNYGSQLFNIERHLKSNGEFISHFDFPVSAKEYIYCDESIPFGSVALYKCVPLPTDISLLHPLLVTQKLFCFS